METKASLAVGDLVAVKGQPGRRFKVAEVQERFDFGARRGGVKPAVRLVREGSGTESWVEASAAWMEPVKS